VHARHILIAATNDTAKQAQAQIAGIKKQIEAEVAADLTKLPPKADQLVRGE
jgi:hypothetical protein